MGVSRIKYGVIYADPPWSYRRFSDLFHGGLKRYGAAVAHYPTMSNEEIASLDVGSYAAKDCALFLWTTAPKMREAIEILGGWGFEYKTIAFVWVKLNPLGQGLYSGLGSYTCSNCEYVLLGVKGHPVRREKSVKQVLLYRRMRHSEKPEEIRRRIERLYAPPYLELFARRLTPGWDCEGRDLLV